MMYIKRYGYLVLVGLPLFFMLSCFLLPLGYMLVLSFSKHMPTGNPVMELTFSNFARLIDRFYLEKVLWLTFKQGLISTIFVLILGYPVAYYISKASPKIKSLLIIMTVMPLWVNTVIRGFGFRILLAENGIVNGALEALSLINTPIKFMGTELGVFLGLTQISIPYVVIPLLSILQTIPASMQEAAQSVGADRLRAFYKITLPLSIPGINAAAVLVFALNVSSLAIPQMLGGGKVRMAAVVAYNQTAILGNFPFGAAIGIVIFILTAGITILYFRLISYFYTQR